MHTCILSHGLKRSWHSCPRQVNAGNKNTPSTHHPQRWNVTTCMVGLENGHIRKNPTQNGEPQRYSWERRRRRRDTIGLNIATLVATLPDARHYTIRAELGLAGPVPEYRHWVRKQVWSATSISVEQQVKLSLQICPWETRCKLQGCKGIQKQQHSAPKVLGNFTLFLLCHQAQNDNKGQHCTKSKHPSPSQSF